jgi:hypothetical protein
VNNVSLGAPLERHGKAITQLQMAHPESEWIPHRDALPVVRIVQGLPFRDLDLRPFLERHQPISSVLFIRVIAACDSVRQAHTLRPLVKIKEFVQPQILVELLILHTLA